MHERDLLNVSLCTGPVCLTQAHRHGIEITIMMSTLGFPGLKAMHLVPEFVATSTYIILCTTQAICVKDLQEEGR